MVAQPSLAEKARLLGQDVFLGGSPKKFEEGGRIQLIALLRNGLNPYSRVLDMGCGCLRGGYWLIHFLSADCYFGIEPNRDMLELGLREFVEDEVIAARRPKFDHNDRFDASVFGTTFDFFLARSVWTHADKSQIESMLDQFVGHAREGGVFLTSYLPAGIFRHRDYRGSGWVGRDHRGGSAGYVYHSLSWIQEVARSRGLTVKELEDDVFQRQRWLRIDKPVATDEAREDEVS